MMTKQSFALVVFGVLGAMGCAAEPGDGATSDDDEIVEESTAELSKCTKGGTSRVAMYGGYLRNDTNRSQSGPLLAKDTTVSIDSDAKTGEEVAGDSRWYAVTVRSGPYKDRSAPETGARTGFLHASALACGGSASSVSLSIQSLAFVSVNGSRSTPADWKVEGNVTVGGGRAEVRCSATYSNGDVSHLVLNPSTIGTGSKKVPCYGHNGYGVSSVSVMMSFYDGDVLLGHRTVAIP